MRPRAISGTAWASSGSGVGTKRSRNTGGSSRFSRARPTAIACERTSRTSASINLKYNRASADTYSGNTTMHLHRFLPVAAALLILSSGSTLVRAQTLADVAKKEEERRKTVSQPAKVYTNKDLNPVPGGSTPPAAKD